MSAVTPVVVVDVVGGGGLVVVVVVVVVVTTTVRVLEVGGAVLAARRAEQGVSLHTLRSRLPPRQGAPPPTAGVATPRVLTWKQYICHNSELDHQLTKTALKENVECAIRAPTAVILILTCVILILATVTLISPT